MPAKYWWIKERENPQIGTYFVAMGQISIKMAKSCESKCLYSYAVMHRFVSKQAYDEKLASLKAAGERVQ